MCWILSITLNDTVLASGENISIQVLDAMKEHLKRLKTNFRAHFPDIDPHMQCVQNPFTPCDTNLLSSKKDSLIGLRSDGALKYDFREKSLTDFWLETFVRSSQLW